MSSNLTSDQHLPFSECKLWEQQRKFYQEQGILAWNNKLPFYGTSNPYIADTYAKIIVHYIQDLLRLNQYVIDEPLYLMELGAGTGMFSYHLVKKLIEHLALLNLSPIKFTYIMADFVADNLKFWQTQPNLQPYIQQGYIDFSHFDIEKQQIIQLKLSNKLLTKNSLKNPLILIANYVFDSLRHDFFQFKKNRLQIGLFNHSMQLDHTLDNVAINLKTIDTQFNYADIKLPFYKNPAANEVLNHYQKTGLSPSFIFPIGAMDCINKLVDITHGKMLLLASDKGYHSHTGLYYRYRPQLVLHKEAFSLAVNFYALARYVELFNGDFYCEKIPQILSTALFTLGNKFSELTATRLIAQYCLDRISPGKLIHISWDLNQIQTINPSTILSYLSSTCWDTQMFNRCLPAIKQLAKQTKLYYLQDLLANLDKVAANFYHIPGGHDTLYDIGNLLQDLHQYKQALPYFEYSTHYFGRSIKHLYSMAMCNLELGNKQQAILLLQEAYEQDKENTLIAGWLDYIQI